MAACALLLLALPSGEAFQVKLEIKRGGRADAPGLDIMCADLA